MSERERVVRLHDVTVRGSDVDREQLLTAVTRALRESTPPATAAPAGGDRDVAAPDRRRLEWLVRGAVSRALPGSGR